MDIRSLQKPLKEQYRNDPNTSKIKIRAKGGQTDVPVACSVDIGRAIYQAEAHKGVGGPAPALPVTTLLGALAQSTALKLVRKGGFEPPRLSAPPPQDGVSASSTTSAL